MAFDVDTNPASATAPMEDGTAAYFSDRVAVVTGGASGIGLALGESMLMFDAKGVVLADIDDAKLADAFQRLNAEYPGRVLAVRCDVTDEADVQQLIMRAAEFGGGHIHLLFNNAGAALWKAFDDASNEDWTRGFALNFMSAVYGTRAVLPIMRAGGGGHIVNTISGIAFWPMPQQSMYAATKAALNALTLALTEGLHDPAIGSRHVMCGHSARSWSTVRRCGRHRWSRAAGPGNCGGYATPIGSAREPKRPSVRLNGHESTYPASGAIGRGSAPNGRRPVPYRPPAR